MIAETTVNREILKNFKKKDLDKLESASEHGRSDLIKVTPNGEICYDKGKNIFIVFDETYADIVGETPYPLVALAMLESYCDEYLGR